jgi:hypothetical protein
VSLTSTERSRLHRTRKRAEAEEVRRRQRGLPPAPTQADAPTGTYLARAGRPRAKVGWYKRVDGTGFAPIPPAIAEETFTGKAGEQRSFTDAQLKLRAAMSEAPPMTPEQELAPLLAESDPPLHDGATT